MTDKVANVFESKAGNIFLNFGARYPNQMFTAYIPKDSADQFPKAKELDGRTVSIRGRIIVYKDRDCVGQSVDAQKPIDQRELKTLSSDRGSLFRVRRVDLGRCKSDCRDEYQSEIESCHQQYDDPEDALDLQTCLQDAKDQHDDCIRNCDE